MKRVIFSHEYDIKLKLNIKCRTDFWRNMNAIMAYDLPKLICLCRAYACTFVRTKVMLFIGKLHSKHGNPCRWRLGRGSNDLGGGSNALGRGSNDLSKSMLKYKLSYP